MIQGILGDLMHRIVEKLEYQFKIKLHNGSLGDDRFKDHKNNEFFFNAGQDEVLEIWKPGQSHRERLKINLSDDQDYFQLQQFIFDWMRDRIRIWIDEDPALREKEIFNQQCRERAMATPVQFSYESSQTSSGYLTGIKQASSLEEAVDQVKDFSMGYVEVTAIFPLFDGRAFKKKRYRSLDFTEKGIEKMEKTISNDIALHIYNSLFATKYTSQ